MDVSVYTIIFVSLFFSAVFLKCFYDKYPVAETQPPPYQEQGETSPPKYEDVIV
jgi:hypothetical protein